MQEVYYLRISWSLLEYQNRPTLTVKVTLTSSAEISQTEIFESWITRQKRFTYSEAQAVQTHPTSPFQATFQTAYLWAEHLYRNRLKAGAIGATPSAQGDWLTEEGSLIQGKRQNSHQAVAHHGPFHFRFKQ